MTHCVDCVWLTGPIVYLRASSIASITGKEGPLRGRLDDARRFHQNFDHQRVAGSGPLARLGTYGIEIKRVAGRTVKAGLSGVEFAPPPPEQVASSPSDRVLATVAASQTSQVGLSRCSLHASEGFCPTNRSKGPLKKARADWGALGPNPTDQVEGLVYLVASLHIQLLHEKNYNRFMAVSCA